MSQLQKIAEAPAPITSLAAHDGSLIASVSTGQIAFLNKKSSSLELLLDTHGGPRGLAVDAKSGDVFFTDVIRKAVVKLELPSAANAVGSAVNAAAAASSVSMSQLWDSLSSSADNASSIWQSNTQLRSFIDSFMDTPLRGPHGITFDAKGEIYVSDPGVLGDTGITNPTGSVLRSIANCQQVVPLAQTGLAYPAALTCHSKTGAIFLCELSANRVLRFAPRTGGNQKEGTSSAASQSMVASVFHQFSGGLGPMSIAIDVEKDLIYVGRFDFAHLSGRAGGEVVVLEGSTGEEAGRITVPGSEITALAVDSKNGKLYIAEGKNLYGIAI